jgi:hypothetical protein
MREEQGQARNLSGRENLSIASRQKSATNEVFVCAVVQMSCFYQTARSLVSPIGMPP